MTQPSVESAASDDLEFQVGQVLGALSVRLPQLDDGGHSWEFETNGTRYELVLEAHAVGEPQHVEDAKGGAVQVTTRITVEIEGSERPALVAEWITRQYA